MIHWIEGAAFCGGLALAVLLTLFPRFGPGSRQLLLLLLPVCLSAGVQALGSFFGILPPQESFRLSFALIIFASAGGYFATSSLKRKAKWKYVIPVSAVSLLLVSLLYLANNPFPEDSRAPDEYIALGLAGYISALYILVLSVIVLANLEQILRNASETVRWELKFLFLGIGAFYVAVVYISSQVLLFPPRSGLLLTSTIGLLHVIFLISCFLIALSLKRGSERSKIAISQGAIYSSITLLSVGAYLIASSLIARWASRWGDIGVPTEALIFLISALFLTALFLGTGFRHRARAWIRRNIFAGRYDYRQFWLEATERLRSTDSPAAIAAALGDLVHRAVGSIDVSVWVRLWNPNRLRLLSALGIISEFPGKEAFGIAEELINISEPVSANDLDSMPDAQNTKEFAVKTHAALLVPLLSSNRIVGVITVGADRSGRPYNLEAREFLRVLAGHAAGEFHKSDLLATLVEAKEDEAFRAFSTFVLHDLKNFASTLSYIAQNAPRHQHNPEFQKDAFQSVYDTAEKMKRLCNSLKTFSTTLAPNKKTADLNQVIRSVADSFNVSLSKRLRLDLGDLKPVWIDAEEVERVFQNLLVNAREAISENGTITVKTRDLGEKIEASVQDDGKGMSREFIEKELFLPFHTTKSGGLGIGLFQSKKIMEAHGGSITVSSEEGKGTNISVTFPVLKQETAVLQIAETAKK
jgi:putative PEP-CTERM system histidine kinase